MPRICCIVNCKSKHGGNGWGKRTLFKLPDKDSEEWKKWMDVITPNMIKEKACRRRLYICDLHFKKSEVKRTYSTILKDRTRHNRGAIRLKRGSVPSFFNIDDREEIIEDSIDNQHKNLSVKSPFIEENLESDKPAPEQNVLIESNIPTSVNDSATLESSNTKKDWRVSATSLGLLFSYYGDDSENSTETILMKEDSTLEIRAGGYVFIHNILKDSRCPEEALSILSILMSIAT